MPKANGVGRAGRAQILVLWQYTMDLASAAGGSRSHPVALAGCRSTGTGSPSCGYDLVLFDGAASGSPTVSALKGRTVIVYHGTLGETRPRVLAGYMTMRIIRDDSMTLAPFLRSVQSRRAQIFDDCARGCLVDSMVCCARALDMETGDEAACWQKCAALRLCEAILAADRRAPSSHALHHLRGMSYPDGDMAQVLPMLGTGRASGTLLQRMESAVAGICDALGVHQGVLRHKAAAMSHDRRLADCYYYLCSRACALMESDRTNPPFAYRMALDVERDDAQMRKNATLVRGLAERLLLRLNS